MPFEKVSDFENGFARVAGNKKYGQQWGIINAKGIFIVPLTYDTIGPFVKNLALVKLDSLYGFINAKGKISIPLKYSGANSFHDGWCAAKQNGKWGFMDEKQRIKIPFEYEDAGYFSEGLCNVKQNGKWGFVNASDSVIVPFKYDNVGMVNNGKFLFYQLRFPRGWGVADLNGKEIIPVINPQLEMISDSCYLSLQSKNAGIILFCDSSGNIVSQLRLVQDSDITTARNYYQVNQFRGPFFVDTHGKEFVGYNQ